MASNDHQGVSDPLANVDIDAASGGRALETLVAINPIDLRAVLDGLSEGFALLDADFTVLDMNAHAICLDGRPRDELIGRSHWDIYPDTNATPLGQGYQTAMRDRVPARVEHRHVWPDGRVAWFDVRANPVNNTQIAVVYRDVTEHHVAEQKLRASEERFRGAVEAFADALWTNDADGRMVGEQPGWAALTGQSHDEYQGYGWSQAVHPDDAQPTIDAWNAAVAERRPFVFEHRVRRRDGLWRRYAIRAVPLLADGAIGEWVGVHSDITEVRESEMRFRQLAEHLDCVFYVHELDEERISYVSPAYERIWQQPIAELYRNAQAFIARVHPDDLPIVREAQERQKAGIGGDLRYRLLIDGQVRHIHDRASVMAMQPGEPRRAVGIAEDVTSTTEARLQLARNARTFESLVRSNPFGVYVIDEHFRLVQASLGTERVFAGIDPLIGRDFAEIVAILWTEPFATEVIERFRHTLATGETYISDGHLEKRQNVERAEAYDWRIDRIELPHGAYGVVCYFYDLSERLSLEADLKQALDDKDMLLREVDHRVRNSLSMVSALLSLQSEASPSTAVKDALAVASSRLQAVARIHEKLYKSRTLGIVAFGEYLDDICSALRASLARDQVMLVVSTISVDLAVDDAVPLGLIANELITNAFKHSGRRDATISISLTCDDNALLLCVSDDGMGMPPDYDLKSAKGLGMQVVNTLVRQLHGTLVGPKPGNVACFTIALPTKVIMHGRR
jgi:PAS domain S-box-containing protein